MPLARLNPVVALFCGVLSISLVAQADTVVIDANQDVYISGSSSQRDNNFNSFDHGSGVVGKLITGSSYYPLVQFDLSSLSGQTITDAYIRGYLVLDPDGDYNSTGYEHEMYLATTNPSNSNFDGGMDETTMTYHIYTGFTDPSQDWNSDTGEVAMDSLGHYSDAGSGIPDAYVDFDSASAADLDTLNNRVKLSNENQRFALFFVDSLSAYRWWDDHEGGNPLQLVLDVIPDPVPEFVIDRSTGNMRLQNNSGATITDVLGYRMTSEVGALDQAGWIPISGNYDAQGDGSVDSDGNWTTLSHTGDPTDLSEYAFTGDGTNLVDGADKNLGDAWIQNPVEDVVAEVQTLDGSIKTASVSFVGGNGSHYEEGDLDFDYDIDVNDYVILSDNLDSNQSGLLPLRAYQKGDLNYDGFVTFDDLVQFASYYDAFNGAGSFASMLASVPEPSSVLLFAVACCCLPGRRQLIGRSLSPR